MPAPGDDMARAVPALTRASLEPHLEGLGELFAALWRIVIPHVPELHTVPWRGRRAAEFEPLKAAVRRHPEPGVPDTLTRYLVGERVGFPADVPARAQAERAFTVMLAIDELAHDIHPSAVAISPSARAPAPGPALSALRQKRWIDGHYGGGGGNVRVVPKGPIYRRSVDEDDLASGDRLDTQFMALAVLEGRSDQYGIRIEAVAPRDFPAGRDPADVEPVKIGMAPVAQDRDDLVFSAVLRRDRPFLDARPRDPDGIRARIGDVLRAVRAADLVVLPELCGTEGATADAVRDVAAAGGGGPARPRLIALGSVLSRELCPHTGKPYNECTVVDANGRVLWRQRKLNHFRMTEGRMGDCGIAAAVARPHAEDVATGTILHVRDLPHFGRVIVLICEDLEQRAPGGDAIHALRPDWVLTPVLDVSQSVGRWTHQRGIEVARLSGARIVVSNSAILATRMAGRDRLSDLPAAGVGIGLCLDMGDARRVKIVTVGDCLADPVAAQFEWAPETWGTWTTSGPR